MTKLKLGPLVGDRPVKLSIEWPASGQRDLIAYVDYLNSQHVSVALTEGGAEWPI